MGSHVCLPSCVPHASTVLSKHRVGVELLFWVWGLGPRPCLRKGGGAGYNASKDKALWKTGLHDYRCRGVLGWVPLNMSVWVGNQILPHLGSVSSGSGGRVSRGALQ